MSEDFVYIVRNRKDEIILSTCNEKLALDLAKVVLFVDEPLLDKEFISSESRNLILTLKIRSSTYIEQMIETVNSYIEKYYSIAPEKFIEDLKGNQYVLKTPSKESLDILLSYKNKIIKYFDRNLKPYLEEYNKT